MSLRLHRRAVLRGAGIALPLPFLNAMSASGSESKQTPRRFCALYTANGMSLPREENQIDDWSLFPSKTGRDFHFNKSTKPLEAFRDTSVFLVGYIIQVDRRRIRIRAQTCG